MSPFQARYGRIPPTVPSDLLGQVTSASIDDLLKLRPYRQHIVHRRTFHKRSPRFYGPFKVLRRVGEVAYELDLPPTAKIHRVVHVSLLRLHKGKIRQPASPLPPDLDSLVLKAAPTRLLGARLLRTKDGEELQGLFEWEGLNALNGS